MLGVILFLIFCSSVFSDFSKFEMPETLSKEMNVLIVVAHPNVEESLNHHLAKAAETHFSQAGHHTRLVDLYKEKFISGGKIDFLKIDDPHFFDYQREQLNSMRKNLTNFDPELKRHIENVMWADLIIFQFPLYFWNVPGALKLFIDRVFVYGMAYGAGSSLGKNLMMSVTSGGKYDLDKYFEWIYQTLSFTSTNRLNTFYIPSVGPFYQDSNFDERIKESVGKYIEHIDKNVFFK